MAAAASTTASAQEMDDANINNGINEDDETFSMK